MRIHELYLVTWMYGTLVYTSRIQKFAIYFDLHISGHSRATSASH